MADLHTVVAIGKVVHRLELLVNNPHARVMGTVGDLLDVSNVLSNLPELLIDNLSSFNSCLGVEFGYLDVRPSV